ncbi:unnamed protein product [Didymodactylos carnosus]|nr:unnamed protein product [Didymodactylos carnosus]CAF4391267.1 unnamed protein product [Didymodactylos carnosus]
MQTYSDDDGQTFMKPEIIQNVTKSNWKWIGFGPPSGILLKSNRILIPSYYSTHLNDNGLLSTGIVMLNDFNGQIDKWFIGGEFSANDELFPNIFPNECQAVELSKPNSIFINARSFGTKRIGVYSLDGGITFSKVNLINNLVQPLTGCQGSMIRHPRTNELFYSGLADINIIRRNLTLYKSNDNGLNWTFLKLIYEQSSAYSSLTILPDQSIGLLYEWANKTDLIFQPDYITFTVVWRP